jgi:hypothetical protein
MAEVLEKIIERRFTINEAADLFRVTPDTIRSEIKKRRLGCIRIGDNGNGKAGKLLIGAGHIHEYLTRFEIKAKANTAN